MRQDILCFDRITLPPIPDKGIFQSIPGMKAVLAGSEYTQLRNSF
jgi:hypothetical protein